MLSFIIYNSLYIYIYIYTPQISPRWLNFECCGCNQTKYLPFLNDVHSARWWITLITRGSRVWGEATWEVGTCTPNLREDETPFDDELFVQRGVVQPPTSHRFQPFGIQISPHQPAGGGLPRHLPRGHRAVADGHPDVVAAERQVHHVFGVDVTLIAEISWEENNLQITVHHL